VEVPRSERQAAPRALLIIAAITAVVSVLLIVVIDQPVARWLAQYEPLALWDRGIDILEYGILLPVHRLALPIVLVTGMIVTFSVPRLRAQAPAWMLLAGTQLVCRFAMIWCKDGTGRLRPTEWLKRGMPDETFGWVGGISFPSGHVVLFASLLIPLAVVAPRTRPLLALVGFAMLARLAVNAHFVSDVVAAITLVAVLTWAVSWLVRPCRRLRPRACRR
jgi:membrane-associated phospholipid phosphatase